MCFVDFDLSTQSWVNFLKSRVNPSPTLKIPSSQSGDLLRCNLFWHHNDADCWSSSIRHDCSRFPSGYRSVSWFPRRPWCKGRHLQSSVKPKNPSQNLVASRVCRSKADWIRLTVIYPAAHFLISWTAPGARVCDSGVAQATVSLRPRSSDSKTGPWN